MRSPLTRFKFWNNGHTLARCAETRPQW